MAVTMFKRAMHTPAQQASRVVGPRVQTPAAPCGPRPQSLRRIRTCGSPYSTPVTTESPAAEPASAPAVQQPAASHANGLGVATSVLHHDQHAQPQAVSYTEAEATLLRLLDLPDLDTQLRAARGSSSALNDATKLVTTVAFALETAYGAQHAQMGMPHLPLVPSVLPADKGVKGSKGEEAGPYAELSDFDSAHLFLQRVLYRINRLNLFWFDDLESYANERSLFIAQVRNAVEAAWQPWEADQFGRDKIQKIKQMSSDELKDTLRARYAADVDPPLSATGDYISNTMGVEGYRQLVAMASLDGLTEASRQSRVCGGAPNSIMMMVFKVLMEEYGAGRLAKKHSTFFSAMMKELSLSDEPECYFDLAPWQIVGPSIYKTYLSAAQRLGLSEEAAGYWALHMKEDERHGRWMLEDVALPLVDKYPADGYEVLLGYEQERFMAGRSAGVVLQRLKDSDANGFKAQPVPFTRPPRERAQELVAA